MLNVWIKYHPAVEEGVMSRLSELETIRSGLRRHGYELTLDIGKRSTRATVSTPSFKSKASYSSLQFFMQEQEARIAEMDKFA